MEEKKISSKQNSISNKLKHHLSLDEHKGLTDPKRLKSSASHNAPENSRKHLDLSNCL